MTMTDTGTTAPRAEEPQAPTVSEEPDASGFFEELKVEGEQLVTKVKEVIREGNVRRVIIKNGEGATLMEIPLTLGVAGAVLLPTLAAVGAIAALVSDCSITVVRTTPKA